LSFVGASTTVCNCARPGHPETIFTRADWQSSLAALAASYVGPESDAGAALGARDDAGPAAGVTTGAAFVVEVGADAGGEAADASTLGHGLVYSSSLQPGTLHTALGHPFLMAAMTGGGKEASQGAGGVHAEMTPATHAAPVA